MKKSEESSSDEKSESGNDLLNGHLEILRSTLRAFGQRPGLNARRRHLINVAAATAAASDEATRVAIEEAFLDKVHSSEIYEVILQGYLTGGYPRTINAFMIFRGVQEHFSDRWRPAPAGWDDPDSPSEWFRRGERLCRRIYGGLFERLRDRLSDLSPDLFSWLLSEGYGKVLGRPSLPGEERELCLLASLIVLGISRQTRSHLRGAFNVGFDARAIDEVIHQCGLFTGEKEIVAARALLAETER